MFAFLLQLIQLLLGFALVVKSGGQFFDFGPLCAFLASPLAGYITGQNICVDGGLTKNVI